ncbi:MAG: right-handed parallel beta-helix repeat-containing protein, partial [Gallionella sp.]|nr:right-handed parallel beta-helix repeat-containing protein [Gallionella sp.]
ATPQHVCYLNVSEVTCGILSTPNTVYTLNRSVSINGSTCFNITAANVTLNCNGYSAAGNNTGSTFGVYSNQANTTVQNCVISGFDAGVYYNGVTTGVVRNTNATSTGPTYGTGLRLTSGSGNVISGSSGTGTFNGILIDSSSNNNVSNSTGNSSTSRGIYIYSSSNNTISDSTAASNSNYALALYSSSGNTFSKNKLLSGAGASILLYIYSTSSGNTFYWNNFTPTSGFYVSDSNGSNFYNTTISGHGEGNIWANVMNGSVAITGTNNSTGFPSLYYGTAGSGYPYNNTTAGGKLSGAVVDYAPLTSATTLTCGLLSTPNTVYTLTSSQSINGATCFNVTAANVTLDCNRYSVTGNNAASTYGVYSSQNFTTIKNCNISGFYAGIYFVGASNGTIRDTNSSSSTGLGIYLNSNSNYTLITGASASSSALYGFYAYAGGFTRINNSNMTSSANSALRLHTCPNATITGSTMSSPQTSLDLEPGSHGASVSNSQILGGASYALLLYAVQNSTFANNTINGRGATYAASVQATSTGNLFVNNTFLNASGMVSLASTCGANRFYWNNFTSASGYYVADANGSNFYNTTISGHGEGNIWANVMNGSVSITGTANSSISGLYVGSSGSGYPYNNTTAGGKLSGPVVDYAPLTPNFCGTWLARTSAGVRSWYGIASSSDGTNLAAVVSSGYIYTSTDSGASWAERTNAGSRSWWSIASSSDGTKLAASVIPGYIYTSTDSGASWTERTGAGSRYWYSIASSLDGTKLAAAVYGGYIYTSTDSGASWTQQTGSGNRSWYGIASSSDGTKLAASVSNGYIYTSTDSGVTWTQRTGSGSRYWYSIASSSDGTMLAATDNNNGIGGYIYTSTDSGASWTARTVAGSRKWQSIASSSNGTMLVANADYDDYIYVSNDSGASWTAQTGMGTSNTARVATSSNGAKIAVARYSGTKYIYTYMSCQ